jgi:hypothetical protein
MTAGYRDRGMGRQQRSRLHRRAGGRRVEHPPERDVDRGGFASKMQARERARRWVELEQRALDELFT